MANVAFRGTPKQERELRKFIKKHKDQPGAMMPVLQEAQGIYGYLPREVQTIIAEEMGVPLSQVFGVATFYSQFTLSPKGEHTVSVCLGTACYVKGADKILAAIEERLGIKAGECTSDGFFSIDSCRCLGACGLAPVMTIDGEVTLNRLTEIKQKNQELVMVRKLVASQAEEMAKHTAYRKQILVCGGTGCTSSSSLKVIEALENELKKNNIEDVLVVKTGCFGLCALGPIVIVYPEGAFYSQTTPEAAKRIIDEHIMNGNICKDLLYPETVHEDGEILPLSKTNFLCQADAYRPQELRCHRSREH